MAMQRKTENINKKEMAISLDIKKLNVTVFLQMNYVQIRKRVKKKKNMNVSSLCSKLWTDTSTLSPHFLA